MSDQVSATYTITDDALKRRRHEQDPPPTFPDAEVITTGLVASRFCGGHLKHARAFLRGNGLEATDALANHASIAAKNKSVPASAGSNAFFLCACGHSVASLL